MSSPLTTSVPVGQPSVAPDSDRPTSALVAWYLIALSIAGPLVVIPFGQNLQLGAVDLLAPLAFVLVLRRPVFLARTPQVLYVVFALIAFASAILASNSESAFRAVRLLLIFAPFLVCMAYELGATRWLQVQRALIVGGGVGLLVAIVMYFLEIDAPGAQQELFVGGVLGNVRRASGLVGNTGPFGHLAATWTCFAFLVGSRDPKFGRTIACVAAILGPAAILLSSSRGAVVNCVVVLVAYVLTRPFSRASGRRTWRASSVVVMFVVMCASVFAAVRLLPTQIVDASIDRLNIFGALEGNNTFTDSSGRYESWPAALSQGLRGPFWGVGPKTYEVGTSSLVDNSFINAFIIAGLVGGFCFLGYWLLLVLGGMPRLRDVIPAAGVAIALGQMAQAFTGDIYTYWYSMPFAFVVLGLAFRPPRVPL